MECLTEIEALERARNLLRDIAQRLDAEGHDYYTNNLQEAAESIESGISDIKAAYGTNTLPALDDDIPF